MAIWNIYSELGELFAEAIEAPTAVEALLILHGGMGYADRVSLGDDGEDLAFADEETAALCGGLDAWDVRQVCAHCEGSGRVVVCGGAGAGRTRDCDDCDGEGELAGNRPG